MLVQSENVVQEFARAIQDAALFVREPNREVPFLHRLQNFDQLLDLFAVGFRKLFVGGAIRMGAGVPLGLQRILREQSAAGAMPLLHKRRLSVLLFCGGNKGRAGERWVLFHWFFLGPRA